ncbi:MAG: ATP-binding protein [Euzebya sp.]
MALARLIDRTAEMARLESAWADVQGGSARLVVVTGRRQVGKTFLLAHMLERIKPFARTVFLTALPGLGRTQQLRAAVRGMRIQLDDPWLPDRFESWGAALRWLLSTASSGDPIAVVIDEVPYLTDADPGFAGEVQQVWDEVRRQQRQPRILLVLTGSSVATMTTLTASSGALFGRPDDELVIHPFDLPTAATVLTNLSPEGVVEAYAACGGYPNHLRSWDQSEDVRTNLARLYFTAGGLLLRNGEQLMADLPDESGHRRALHAIGSGLHRRSEIEQAAAQRLDRPLDLLQRATLITHRRPLGAPDRTPGLWRILDPFLNCWYQLAWADAEQIEAGLGDGVASAREGRWQRHVGEVFEDQSRSHAVRLALAGRLPPETRYGEWWTTRGGQVQIDVLGLRGRRTVLIGEARWDARPSGDRVLEELRAKERAAPDPVTDPILALWSRGGVADTIAGRVTSFTPHDMVAG